MIVVTGYERVGLLNECEVLRATTFQILPLPRDLSALSDPQVEDEQTFVHLVQDHLRQNTFYFSYAYDLTLSLQKQQAQYLAAEHEPTWRKVALSARLEQCSYWFGVGRSTLLLEPVPM